jgi:hypothetical protein
MTVHAPWTRAARLARMLAERYTRRRAAPLRPDLVVPRLRPLVQAQAWNFHTRFLIAPRFTVAVAAAPVRGAIGTAPLSAEVSSPSVTRIVERLFTRTTRVESVQSSARPPLAGSPLERRASSLPAAPLGAAPAARILARVRQTQSPDPRTLASRAEPGRPTGPAERDPVPPAWPAAPAPAMPPLDLARLTDRLARELGQRVIAYRERLGRR